MKLTAAFVSIVLTLLALTLIFVPFIPSPDSEAISTSQHVFMAILGVVSLAAAIRTWIWSTTSQTTAK